MTNFDYVANVHKISCYMNSILSIFEANKIATQMETEEMMLWKCILYGTTFFFHHSKNATVQYKATNRWRQQKMHSQTNKQQQNNRML